MSATYFARLSTDRYGSGVELIGDPGPFADKLRRGAPWRPIVREYVTTIKEIDSHREVRRGLGKLWSIADKIGDRIVIEVG